MQLNTSGLEVSGRVSCSSIVGSVDPLPVHDNLAFDSTEGIRWGSTSCQIVGNSSTNRMTTTAKNIVQSHQNAGDITYHTIANLSGIVQSNVALDIVGGGQSGDRYITFANIASSHDPTARTTTGVGNKSFAFGMEGEETNTTIRAVFRTNSSGSSKPCANPSSYNLEGFRLTDVGNDTNVAVDFPNINTTGASANAVFDSNNQLLKSTSSLRYKTDVQPLVNVIDTSIVLDIEIKYFKHNGDNQYYWGVIAEEIEQIYPGICQYIELNGEQVVDNVENVKLIMPLIE
mmetsp:Transcript_6242/g.23483  ORF Transcript_6242/g.23483 Transcript_6242/m.23483 type:complete len:288 (-) Transcript_6242:57-920(-)